MAAIPSYRSTGQTCGFCERYPRNINPRDEANFTPMDGLSLSHLAIAGSHDMRRDVTRLAGSFSETSNCQLVSVNPDPPPRLPPNPTLLSEQKFMIVFVNSFYPLTRSKDMCRQCVNALDKRSDLSVPFCRRSPVASGNPSVSFGRKIREGALLESPHKALT